MTAGPRNGDTPVWAEMNRDVEAFGLEFGASHEALENMRSAV
jgi:hypothetical protein